MEADGPLSVGLGTKRDKKSDGDWAREALDVACPVGNYQPFYLLASVPGSSLLVGTAQYWCFVTL